jgi:hypothetical protein
MQAMLMLIDTREPPDDGHRPRREPWFVRLLSALLPWPAIIVWFCAAALILNGWIAVGCAFVAIGLSAWRGLRLMPTDGLNQTRQ